MNSQPSFGILNDWESFTLPVIGSRMAGSIPKKGTVAEPGLVSIAPGNGVTMMDPVSVCLLLEITLSVGVMICWGDKCTPVSIDDGTLATTDDGIVPVPSLGVDGLADGAEDPDCAEVVTINMVSAETTKESDGGGSRVELGELVSLDGLPVPGGCRVDWGRLEDGGGDAV
jgi:hypothetical protein